MGRPNYCPKIVPVALNSVLTSHVPFFLACNRTPLIFPVILFLKNELITNETPSIGLILIAGSLLYSNPSKQNAKSPYGDPVVTVTLKYNNSVMFLVLICLLFYSLNHRKCMFGIYLYFRWIICFPIQPTGIPMCANFYIFTTVWY